MEILGYWDGIIALKCLIIISQFYISKIIKHLQYICLSQIPTSTFTHHSINNINQYLFIEQIQMLYMREEDDDFW